MFGNYILPRASFKRCYGRWEQSIDIAARHLTKEKLSKEESSDFIQLTGSIVEQAQIEAAGVNAGSLR